MKKTSLHILFSGLLALALAGGTAASAADTTAQSTNAVPKAKRDWYPFYGTVAAVDQSAKTISLKKKEGERVLKIDSKTGLEINGKPAILADVKVGSYAHGKLHKDSNGAEVIMASKFDKEPPVKGAAKEKTTSDKTTTATLSTATTADQSATNSATADKPAKKKRKKPDATNTNAVNTAAQPQ
jgi:hypothetical protein